MAFFKKQINELKESIESLEIANKDLTKELEEAKLELGSYNDQSETIATLESELQEQKDLVLSLTEEKESVEEALEVKEQEEVDVALEVAKQTVEVVADLGVEAVEIDEDESEMTVIDQYNKLTGSERTEFFRQHKAEILKTAKLNLYTK